MKYFIKTFGCQMNYSDSERIAGLLEMEKIKPAKDINTADIVVFNTCGVRQMAEDRVYGQIHNIGKQESGSKNQGKKIIILTGCLANRKDVQIRLKNKVDLFVPTSDIFKIRNSKLFQNLKFEIQNSSQINSGYLKILPKYANSHTAYVPIMTGCNNFCAYCVVPYARGREVSRPVKEILAEVRDLVKKGYKEIILLGQNVNSYKDKGANFSQLLKKVDSIPGHFWIWFVSNHPKDFSDKLIEMTTRCQKVSECVHLPLQAGDDRVLQNMNRKYTAKKYLDLVEEIRKSFAKNKPGKIFSLTSDIIVGFPGETKKQFLESAKIMKKAKYDMVYFGQFSPRPGTAAWNMKDDVSKKEKERREEHLNEILKKTTSENNKQYAGKTLEVLVTQQKDGHYFGHTRTQKNVKVISEKKNLVGQIVNVKITKTNIWNLEGRQIISGK